MCGCDGIDPQITSCYLFIFLIKIPIPGYAQESSLKWDPISGKQKDVFAVITRIESDCFYKT